MATGQYVEGPGENMEFAIGTAGEEVTIYLNGGTTGDKTSSDDTATEKYMDTYQSRRYFQIRNDQAISILSINGFVFTDPISIVKNAGHIEKWDTKLLFKMVIKTTIANTNIKLRVR